jgi:NAD+ synthase (glutamine-hydrolysing)
VEDFNLPMRFRERFPDHAGSVPIGIIVIETLDATVSAETCEELFTPNSPHIAMSLDGVF